MKKTYSFPYGEEVPEGFTPVLAFIISETEDQANTTLQLGERANAELEGAQETPPHLLLNGFIGVITQVSAIIQAAAPSPEAADHVIHQAIDLGLGCARRLMPDSRGIMSAVGTEDPDVGPEDIASLLRDLFGSDGPPDFDL